MLQYTFEEIKDFAGALAYVSRFANKYGIDVIVHHGAEGVKKTLVTFVGDEYSADCEISSEGRFGDYVSTADVSDALDAINEALRNI